MGHLSRVAGDRHGIDLHVEAVFGGAERILDLDTRFLDAEQSQRDQGHQQRRPPAAKIARFVDDVIRARQIVGSGILGELMVFENAFASRVDMSRRWNADPAISGGGVLIDNGTHSVDIVRYFLGPIAEVMAVEGKRVQHLPVEDTASMLLRTPEGVLGTVDLSWSVDRVTDTYLTLYGSEGTVSVGWKGARYRQASSPEWVTFGDGYDKHACMGAQVANFSAAIRGDEPLAVTADDAIASVAVIEAAYVALERSDWITVRALPGGDRPRVSRWHDASELRSAHPSHRGDRSRGRDR